MIGRTLAHYRITAANGAGKPASARGANFSRELWRGLAEAKLESRS